MPARGKKIEAGLLSTLFLTILLLAALAPLAEAKATPTPVPQICAVTGRVVDTHGSGIGGAKVTLYNVSLSGGKIVETGLTTVDSNPQYTTGGSDANIGYFQFFGVPAGSYEIMVDSENQRVTQLIQPTSGTYTLKDIVISPAPANGGPTAAVKPAPAGSNSPIVTVIAGPTPPVKKDSGEPLLLRAGVALLIGLQFILACVVLWLYGSRRI